MVPGAGRKFRPGSSALIAELDRVPARLRVGVPEFLAVRDPEHLPDQVDPGDLLRHRVLDLKPGVDLEERHRAVLPDEKLTGTRAHITGLPQDGLGRPVQLLGLAGGQERRGRLLDQLLVPALQRAVPGGDHHHVPVGVGEALGLHMPRPVQVALDEALAAAERRDGFADRGLVRLADLVWLADHLQPPAAAAERRLDGDRQAVLGHERLDFFHPADRPVGARGHRGADRGRDLPRGHLVAQRLDGGRRGPDPDQPGVQDRLGEAGVLGQEAVAGVDGVGPGLGRYREDLLDAEVALRGARAAERVGLVGHRDVQGVEVGFGVYGHAAQPGVPAGSHHADRDLATIRNKHLAHESSPPDAEEFRRAQAGAAHGGLGHEKPGGPGHGTSGTGPSLSSRSGTGGSLRKITVAGTAGQHPRAARAMAPAFPQRTPPAAPVS